MALVWGFFSFLSFLTSNDRKLVNKHITYLIFASFNKYTNDVHEQSTYFAAFLLDLLSNNKCFKMYASANQLSKCIVN